VLWLFPYALGGTALLGVAMIARRWSHHEGEAVEAAQRSDDAALNERLNDELRDLD
jgi:hypothetical protein